MQSETIRSAGLERMRKIRRIAQEFPDDFDEIPVALQRNIVVMLGEVAEVIEAILTSPSLDAPWDAAIHAAMTDDSRYSHSFRRPDGSVAGYFDYDAPPVDAEPYVEPIYDVDVA